MGAFCTCETERDVVLATMSLEERWNIAGDKVKNKGYIGELFTLSKVEKGATMRT